MRFTLLLFLLLLIPVPLHKAVSDVPRDGATLEYSGEYITDSYTIRFNLSVTITLSNDTYSLVYNLTGIKEPDNTTISDAGEFSDSISNPIEFFPRDLPLVFVAYHPKAFVKMLNGYFKAKLGFYNVTSMYFEGLELSVVSRYSPTYNVSYVIEVDSLVVKSFEMHRGFTFYYTLKASQGLEPYPVDEESFEHRATRAIGLNDEFRSFSVETYKLYSIGPMRLVSYHGYVYNGTLMDFYGLSGHIEGMFLMPFFIVDPMYVEGFSSRYKTPFIDVEALYGILEEGDYKYYIGYTPEGLVVSSLVMPEYRRSFVLSDLEIRLASVKIIQRNASIAELRVYANFSGRIAILSEGKEILNESIAERIYANFSDVDFIQIIVSDGSHGLYRISRNLYVSEAPKIEASINETLEISIVDFVPVDILTIYVNDTLRINTTFAVYQTLELNFTGRVTVFVINPLLGTSSSETIYIASKPKLEVSYNVTDCIARFFVRVESNYSTFRLLVYVDGRLIIEENITKTYSFTLKLNGTHSIEIKVIDPIGQKASRINVLGCTSEGSEKESSSSKKAFFYISLAIVVVLAIALALLRKK